MVCPCGTGQDLAHRHLPPLCPPAYLDQLAAAAGLGSAHAAQSGQRGNCTEHGAHPSQTAQHMVPAPALQDSATSSACFSLCRTCAACSISKCCMQHEFQIDLSGHRVQHTSQSGHHCAGGGGRWAQTGPLSLIQPVGETREGQNKKIILWEDVRSAWLAL